MPLAKQNCPVQSKLIPSDWMALQLWPFTHFTQKAKKRLKTPHRIKCLDIKIHNHADVVDINIESKLMLIFYATSVAQFAMASFQLEHKCCWRGVVNLMRLTDLDARFTHFIAKRVSVP